MSNDKYTQHTTDELLELLPDNLCLVQNKNAPQHDRWRIMNTFTRETPPPGYSSPRQALEETLARIDRQISEWTGRGQ